VLAPSFSPARVSVLPANACDDKNQPPAPPSKALPIPTNESQNHNRASNIIRAPNQNVQHSSPLASPESIPAKVSKLSPTAPAWREPTSTVLVISPTKVPIHPPEEVKANVPTRTTSDPTPVANASNYLEYSGFPRLPRESNASYESRIRRVGSVSLYFRTSPVFYLKPIPSSGYSI
jgi:hypothetical protein